MNFPSRVGSLSVCLALVIANFLPHVATTCAKDPSSIQLPVKCPDTPNSKSLVLHKMKNSTMPVECVARGGPVVISYSRSYVIFHCCFSGYTTIRWLFSYTRHGPFQVSPECIGRYENHTFLLLQQLNRHYSGYYRCEAVGARGERLSVVQRLLVLPKPPRGAVRSPKFGPKCDLDTEIVKGSSLECVLKVTVTRKAEIVILVVVDQQITATCTYRPFCDRLLEGNLTGAICHRNRSSNLRFQFEANKDGTSLLVSLSPEPGLPLNVTFTAWEASLPQDTTVWRIRTNAAPPERTAFHIIVSCSVLILVFAAVLTSTWIFAFNIQLMVKGQRCKDRTVRPCVRILSHPGNDDIAYNLSEYLEKTCDIKEALAGVPDCEITMRTGVDKTCILLILLDVNAVFHEPFVASMSCLLLRESARRVYVCLDSINAIEKQAAGNEDSKKLIKRINADLKFCNKVPVKRRYWKWVRWQVLTCLRLAAVSILRKIEPETMQKRTCPSTSSDSGLGSFCSDL